MYKKSMINQNSIFMTNVVIHNRRLPWNDKLLIIRKVRLKIMLLQVVIGWLCSNRLLPTAPNQFDLMFKVIFPES